MDPLLQVEDLQLAYERHEAVRGAVVRARARRDRLPARSQRLRQDHGAALHRRLRDAVGGPHPAQRHGGLLGAAQPAAGEAAHRHGVPGARAVSAPDGRGQYCFWLSNDKESDGPRAGTGSTRRHHRAPATSIRTNSPAASSSASRSRARSRRARTCCCSTSRSPTSTPGMRERLSLELRDIIKASGATAVLVTHDQHEAFAIADEIGVMHDGRIEQWDLAYNLYHRPAEPLRRRFRRPGRVPAGARCSTRKQIEIELGVLDGDIPHACQIGCDVCGKGCLADVLLRPGRRDPRRRTRPRRPRWCTRRSAAPRSSTR